MADVLICREGFHADLDGNPVTFNVGEMVSSDSRWAKAFGQYFEPAKDKVRPDIEQATKAPGEKRAAPRRKSTAKAK